MKKISAIITALATGAALTGCTFGASIDTLMTPPKLGPEQEKIYSELTRSLGTSNISLKYPKSGKYLSAFIIEDIDGDGGNEAMVFYERNNHASDENSLRINILDKKDDGQWSSVYDKAAEGSEIEKVIISKLGSNDRINIIIGTSMINRSEKNVTIYNYVDGVLRDPPTFSRAYSYIDVRDLDMDGELEFLTITGSSGSEAPAKVVIYTLDSDGQYFPMINELSGAFTDFEVNYGTLGNGRTGIYVDSYSAPNSIKTDVFYMDDNKENNSKRLAKVDETAGKNNDNSRPAGCTSFDIDGDGQLEIPVQTLAPGYTDTALGEQLRLTEWKQINSDNKFETRYISYYSINDGYIFLFPERWKGKVTVKRDIVEDEIVFYSYTTGKNNEVVLDRDLLHICCAEDEASRADKLSGEYMLMHTKGDSSCLALLPKNNDTYGDGLSLTMGEAAVGFRYRD